MPDMAPFSDDISALWGHQEASALVPPRPETSPETSVQALQEVEPTPINGSDPRVAGDATDEGVARLARALAAHQTDVVSRTELERSHRLDRPVDQLERIDGAAAQGSAKLDDLSDRLSSVQDDVAALRASVAELRHAIAGTRWRRRRLGRSAD